MKVKSILWGFYPFAEMLLSRIYKCNINGTALVFFSPNLPYTIEALEESKTGGYFIFRESYFSDHYKSSIREFSIFAKGYRYLYMLNKTQEKFIGSLFKKIRQEMASAYKFKHDLIRNAIMELLHFALKMQPTEELYANIDARVRITAVFNELMDRQFPLESPRDQFSLRSAGDFAKQLNIHVNYLNRAVKATTGKTTTEHIFERFTSEAVILLKHAYWSIAEISYSLGFDEPNNFNHFFKKQTGKTPSSFRSRSSVPAKGAQQTDKKQQHLHCHQ